MITEMASKFADLKAKFNQDRENGKLKEEREFREWILVLMLEIHGDLDSLSYRMGEILRGREKE